MLKKRVAIFFILLANFILLAHDIIPHHHHEGEVCIFNLYCPYDGDAYKYCSNDKEHEQNGKSDYECCLLNQAVVIPSNSIKQYCKCADTNEEGAHCFHFYANVPNLKFESFVTAFQRNPIPPLIFSHAQILNNSLGLRAPPIV